jgi:hypothetical protein
MVDHSELILGGVYNVTLPSPNLVRVIGQETDLVLYDHFVSVWGKWSIADFLKRSNSYYRTNKSIFQKNATLLRVEPLTKKEIDILRPDLPYRMFHSQTLDWSKLLSDEPFNLINVLTTEKLNPMEVILPIQKVAIYPFGSKGRVTSIKPIVYEASNEMGFTYLELLRNALSAQRPHSRVDGRKGIGVYRAGHFKSIPSYFNEECRVM